MKELLCQEDTWLVSECCFLIWPDFQIIYFSKCHGSFLRSEHQLPVHKQIKNIERLSRITPSRDCGMLTEGTVISARWDLEFSCVIMTSPFHQRTPGSLFSLYFQCGFRLLPSVYQILLSLWPWTLGDKLLNLLIPNHRIMAVIQEVRSQLEIQLQKWNSELPVYCESKEVFPVRKLGSCDTTLPRNEAVAVSCCCYCLKNDNRWHSGGSSVILQQEVLVVTHWSKRAIKDVLSGLCGRMKLK